MKRRERIVPVMPSHRQMLAKSIEYLVASHRIMLSQTDDDMLWCVVDMREPPDSVLVTLGIVTMSWGMPIPISMGNREAVYLFSMLEGRIRDRIN